MIVVSHLTRRYGPLLAIDDLTFEIERGEVVGFLGPNGAGKTTTMRILAGSLSATSGAARVAGFDVLRDSLEVRRRIGYLPEGVPLYGDLRVREMVEFHGRLHGLRGKELARRAGEVLERVGVADRERDLVQHLSRGLRQRVGLAVSLLPAPEVLILDEPTSGLDPLQRIEVRQLVRELAEKHTVLLSSHILPEVEAVCPRVIVLHRGRIAADGTREDLVRSGGESSAVRVEAVVGPDPEAARRLFASLPGVRAVLDRGRLGIHHGFEVQADEDLREDVGALCQAKGWALRELSWHQPTLEQLFARIALGLGEERGAAAPAPQAPEPAPSSTPASAPLQIAGAPAAAPARRPVYNLNPFERGPVAQPPGRKAEEERAEGSDGDAAGDPGAPRA